MKIISMFEVFQMNNIMYDALCPRDVTMSVTVYYLLTANNEVIDSSMYEGVQMNKITKSQ